MPRDDLTPSDKQRAITVWRWLLWLRTNAPTAITILKWLASIGLFSGSLAWLSAEPSAPGAPLSSHWTPVIEWAIAMPITVKLAGYGTVAAAIIASIVVHHIKATSAANREAFRQSLREGLAPVAQLLEHILHRQDEMERRQDESDARVKAAIDQLRKDAAIPGAAPATGTIRTAGLIRDPLDPGDVDGLAPDDSRPEWAITRRTAGV